MSAPIGCTRTLPRSAARSTTKRTALPSSQIGSVLGMRADRGEAAVRGRTRAARDVFLVLVAGLAQVRVHVDEARDDDLLGALDGGALGDGQVVADLDDHARRR